MASLTVTDYWSPRQLDDHQALSNWDSALNGTGLTGFFIAGISDAADTGVTDTGEFFSIADANVGATTDEPEWQFNGTIFEWINQDATPDQLPVTVIGRTQEGAAANTTLKAVFVPAGDDAAIYLSEIEHITSTDPYTVPAGDWTARLYVTNANASIFIHKVVVLKVGWYGYSGNLVFGGPGTSVIHTHTETAPFTVLGTAGTYSVNFTTTSDTTIDPTPQASGGAAEKLVVMFIVGNSTVSNSAIRFRHNQNILTPIPAARTLSLDSIGLSSAVKVPVLDRVVPATRVDLSAAAKPVSLDRTLPIPFPTAVTTAVLAPNTLTVFQLPSATGLSAAAQTPARQLSLLLAAQSIPLLLTPQVRTLILDRQTTASRTRHTAVAASAVQSNNAQHSRVMTVAHHHVGQSVPQMRLTASVPSRRRIAQSRYGGATRVGKAAVSRRSSATASVRGETSSSCAGVSARAVVASSSIGGLTNGGPSNGATTSIT
jgi:hypothetical protein